MATALKTGDSFPEGVEFTYVPPTGKQQDIVACGLGVKYDLSQEAKNKKIVLVSVPGAFTPTCQEQHLAGYIAKRDELKAKGVDKVIFIAYNDHWVMSAWAKANGVFDDYILFMSDDETKFSQSIGWTAGARTARYAIAIDHGKVVYAEKESTRGLEVSGVDSVLAKL